MLRIFIIIINFDIKYGAIQNVKNLCWSDKPCRMIELFSNSVNLKEIYNKLLQNLTKNVSNDKYVTNKWFGKKNNMK